MKFWAGILLLNITFFLIQPVFAAQPENECVKNCCPESNKNKKECPKNCNPLFTCMYCQYVPAKGLKIEQVKNVLFKEYITELNPNVLKGFVANSWHPPNIISSQQ